MTTPQGPIPNRRAVVLVPAYSPDSGQIELVDVLELTDDAFKAWVVGALIANQLVTATPNKAQVIELEAKKKLRGRPPKRKAAKK